MHLLPIPIPSTLQSAALAAVRPLYEWAAEQTLKDLRPSLVEGDPPRPAGVPTEQLDAEGGT